MTRRRKLLEAARKLAASADSSEEEVAVVRTNQEALEVLSQTINSEAITVIIRTGSKRPVQQTDGAAGYDLCAVTNVELPPGQVTPVPLNLRLAIPAGYYMQLASRSGLASRGLLVTGGVVDADFRGEVKALILNWADTLSLSRKVNGLLRVSSSQLRELNLSNKMSYQLVSAVMLVLVALECSNTDAFMLEYTDCIAPEQIKRVDVARVCEHSLSSASSNKRMMLTQTKTVTRLTGYKCKIKESRFCYYSHI